jgi:opacity protein-like surface antigen
MKKMILLAALTLACTAWAQAPAPKPEAQTVKSAPKAAQAAKKKQQSSWSKRHQDARHCLQRTDNDAIIRCAEEYL